MIAADTPALTPAQRAAVIVLLLDEGAAASVLAHLQPHELEQVGAAMCAMGDVDNAAIADAVNAFAGVGDGEMVPAGDRHPHVAGLLTRAVGKGKAAFMMERIDPAAPVQPLEIARWLTPEALLTLVADEPPQVLAVLLLMLEAVAAARLLSLLPSASQADVVERVAKLGKVPAPARGMLNALLEHRIAARVGAGTLSMGGARDAADLINRVAGGLDRQVLPAIATHDAALARTIEAELVTFPMLLALGGQQMGRLLRDVDNAVLVDALKGLDEDGRAPVLAAMSARAADGVRDDIELRGRIRKSEVEAAQASMVATARQLAEAGEIVLGAGSGEFI